MNLSSSTLLNWKKSDQPKNKTKTKKPTTHKKKTTKGTRGNLNPNISFDTLRIKEFKFLYQNDTLCWNIIKCNQK